MNDSPGALDLLSERVHELERRVRALEHSADADTAPAQSGEPEPAQVVPPPSLLETGRVIPIVGRAMLGIAGAYLLRALAASSMMPMLLVAAFGVAYAFGWLAWSAWIPNKTARSVYAGTAALILAPMLWENTLAFHVFTPMSSAGLLAGFLTLAIVLDLRNAGSQGTWVAQTIALLTTAALGFTTLHGFPFVVALLIAVFVSEFARTLEFPQPAWPLIVLVADVALWGLIFIYSGPQDTRALYPPMSSAALIAPAFLLFATNGTAVAVRVMIRKCRIMIFEAIQVSIAFALSACALITFGPEHRIVILGILCLVLSVTTYLIGFRFLLAREERRSFSVFAIWSAALLATGSICALPTLGGAVLLAVASAASIYLATRIQSGMLLFHGTIFLTTAAILSRLPEYLYGSLAGIPPAHPSSGIVVIAICAMGSMLLSKSKSVGVWEKVLRTILAAIAICSSTALALHGVFTGAFALGMTHGHHAAFLRTLTICTVALAIAFIGARWHRPELTHLSYAALALIGIKLLLQDLRTGHMGLMAASIALFAVTLMGVPRLVRLGVQRARSRSQ
ncbi:MAG: hypothetical protein JST28_05745 [Acidobacteria bacterium]|nr:hypothetical protein [Acidobacteriota bacterium]